MEYALLAARLFLAAVFLVSSVGKFLDLEGARKAVKEFGLPASLAPPAAILLPIAELAIAIFLIPKATAWYAAVASLLLLAVFIVAIAFNMVQGRAPDCHCFGQFHSSPAGWTTLVRNSVFGAISLFVVLYGTDRWSFSHGNAGASVVGWIRDLSTSEQISWVLIGLLILAVIALGWFVVHLLGQNGRVLLRVDALEGAVEKGLVSPEAAAQAAAAIQAGQKPAAAPTPAPAGLPVGSVAPQFKLEGLHGETMTLDALRASGKPLLLLFTDPGCGPCNALLPDVAKWQKDLTSRLNVSLISSGAVDRNKAKASEHGIAQVFLQEGREVSSQFRAAGTPSAVLIDSDGKVASPVAAGAEAIRQLVSKSSGTIAAKPARPAANQQAAAQARSAANQPAAQAANQPAAQASQQPRQQAQAAAARSGNGAPAPERPAGSGKPAPAVSLQNLDGNTVTLADFKGKPTLVVFWNPGCGFCKRMTEEIQEWEKNRPKDAPQILLVSRGTPESNRELGLKSPTVLDDSFGVARSFGASGTPSAVLVDAQGNIASEVAVGAPGVMALARNEKPAAAPAAPPKPASKKGSDAPAVSLKDLDGNTVNLSDYRGQDTMLVFWNPGCGFCNRMTDDLKEFEANPPAGAPTPLIVSTGTEAANRELGFASTVVLDEGFATGRQFGASGTPSAILVDANGKIASDVAVGAPGVLALAKNEEAPARAEAPAPAPAAKQGAKAPNVKLPDLDGNQFDLSSQSGKETVLMFWNPGCGFCKRMTDDLNNWMSQRPADAPEVVLVSTGTADANREQGINAPILLDEGFTTGRQFGAGGTPSAIKIDANGNISSEVAVGAQAVLSLAGAPQEAAS